MHTPKPKPPANEPPTVLIVDDEPTIRDTLHRYVDACGYRVVEASDVDDALDLLALNKVAVVILDVRLPTSSGLELLAALRGHDEFAQIPAIVFTGYALTPDEAALIKQHNASVLYKPEHPDALIAQLDRITGRTPRT